MTPTGRERMLRDGFRVMLKYFTPLLIFLPAMVALALAPDFATFFYVNAGLQFVLFLTVVHIPAFRTDRMSYVDIAWPLGLAVIGGLALALGTASPVKKIGVGVLYLFMGLRMGGTALLWWSRGALNKELPRYKFQRIRWKQHKKTNKTLAMQVDILLQGLANMGFLALPAVLIAFSPDPELRLLEIAGAALWLLAFAGETLADKQKGAFVKRAVAEGEVRAVCDVGLWRYTRHPNYFCEWMVWNALIVASLPGLWSRVGVDDPITLVVLAASLFFISRIMYTTLVLFTGAAPSEYYSMKKRPGYKEYRRRTNMFFPGPVRS